MWEGSWRWKSSFLQSIPFSWRTTSLGLAEPKGFGFCFWFSWNRACSSSSFSTSSAHEKAAEPFFISLSTIFSLSVYFLNSNGSLAVSNSKVGGFATQSLPQDVIYVNYKAKGSFIRNFQLTRRCFLVNSKGNFVILLCSLFWIFDCQFWGFFFPWDLNSLVLEKKIIIHLNLIIYN